MRLALAVQQQNARGQLGNVSVLTPDSEAVRPDFFDRVAALITGSAEIVTSVTVEYCDGSKLLLDVTGWENP